MPLQLIHLFTNVKREEEASIKLFGVITTEEEEAS
jgi:hypothetical protein